MSRSVVETSEAPGAVGPYSQGIKGGGFVYCSGQLPMDLSGAIPTDIRLQTHQSLKNVSAVLVGAGASLGSVVKTTVFLKDMNDFAAMNEVYATYFEDAPPARSTVEVARLPRDVMVEIEAIALLETN